MINNVILRQSILYEQVFAHSPINLTKDNILLSTSFGLSNYCVTSIRRRRRRGIDDFAKRKLVTQTKPLPTKR